MVRSLVEHGCAEVVIESHGVLEDERDKRVILDVLREDGAPAALKYGWRTKDDPLLWVADAAAGIARSEVLGVRDRWSERFQEVAVLDLEYVQSGP